MRRKIFDHCLDCGEPMVRRNTGNIQTEEYAQNLHKACYERVRRARNSRAEARVFPIIKALDEQYDLKEFECFWCQEEMYLPQETEEKAQAEIIFGWFLDEAICRWHIEFALDWAKYLLKDQT